MRNFLYALLGRISIVYLPEEEALKKMFPSSEPREGQTPQGGTLQSGFKSANGMPWGTVKTEPASSAKSPIKTP